MQHQKTNELEPILKYSMDDMEAKAFKIGLIWHDECERNLSGEKYEKFSRGKDPRKTNLFRHCYKVAKELLGIVPDNEIQLYVRAQVQVLKSIREGKVHAMISPHCLVGDRAWKRWKVWRRIYQKSLSKSLTCDELGIKIKEMMVKGELERAFSFIESKGLMEKSKYDSSKKDIERWSSTGELSPFYMILSPRARALFHENEFPVDMALYRPSITPALEDFFRDKFNHEF